MTDELDKTIPPQRAGNFNFDMDKTMPGYRDRKTDGRFAVGDLIMGRYKVLAELGQGGMGVVYKCFDETAGIEVALKALPPELSHNSLEMEDIKENFQLVHALFHPHIAASNNLERNPENGNYYLIMECCEGEDLRRWIKRKRKDNPLTLDDVLPVIRQVADALDYAHGEKVMHRDIKPGNIMINSDGKVKVLDFGLAAQIHTSMTRVSMAYHGTSGTGPYMAPEQWRGRAQGAAADQYALAVMAYEMLAGRLPFESTDPSVLREAVLNDTSEEITDLPAAAQSALKRAMSKEAAERFNSCADFAAALGGAKVGKAKKVSSGKSGGAWKWIAAVIVLALIAAGAFFALNRNTATPTAPVPADTAADAEARAKAEARKAEAEARRIAAEQKAAEAEALRLAAEKKAAEAEAEARRIAAEQKAAEAEALRLAAEKKAAEAEARAKAAEQKAADAAQKTVEPAPPPRAVAPAPAAPVPPPRAVAPAPAAPAPPPRAPAPAAPVPPPRAVAPAPAAPAPAPVPLPGAEKRKIKEEPTKTIYLDNGVSLKMIRVEPGSFMMGSENGESDEKPVHRVTLTQAYYLGETEVTQAQWRAVMGNNPSRFQRDSRPVEQVSWNDAMAFCKKLNDEGRAPKGWKFTLPTEAQWEFACRAGTTTNYSYGDASDVQKMNFDGNYPYGGGSKGVYRQETVAVKSLGYKNAWGFYDMHGNVYEWCLDWYGSRSYSSEAVTDPQGPQNGSDRVLRGGGWCTYAQNCRSANRNNDYPDYRYYYYGFRVALVPVQ